MENNVLFKDADFKMSSCCDKHRMCVEVAIKPDAVGVRDTKDPNKHTLVFTRDEWAAFIAGVCNGEFNL